MDKVDKILELIKKYNPKAYEALLDGDKVVVEDHLDWLCEKYSLEAIEKALKSGNDKHITLDY